MTYEEKNEIEKQLMTEFMKYFKENRLNRKDKQTLRKMQNCITQIVKLETAELGYMCVTGNENNKNSRRSGRTIKLEFINKKRNKNRGEQSNGIYISKDGAILKTRPKITYNTYWMYEGLDSKSRNVRLNACKDLFQTIFHELQHFRQNLMTEQNVSSLDALRYGRDFACQVCLQDKWYSGNEKVSNYDNYLVENNANEVAYNQYLEIMGNKDPIMAYSRDIESGYANMNRYIADVKSRDGETYYKSDDVQERDDITVPILDDLICKKGYTEILELYPILQKEYNLNGTKKTATELIINLKQETKDLKEMYKNSQITKQEMDILIDEAQRMYYELIYRQIENITPRQMRELVEQVGKDEATQILNNISKYFSEEKERRKESAERAMTAEIMLDDCPFNNGRITIKKNGKKKKVKCDDFIKTLDPKLLEKEIEIASGRKIPASEAIKKYYFKWIPQDGEVTLRNGKKISAKQYIEKYALKQDKFTKYYSPRRFVSETMYIYPYTGTYLARCSRLDREYRGKKLVLTKINKAIQDYNPEQYNGGITKKQLKVSHIINKKPLVAKETVLGKARRITSDFIWRHILLEDIEESSSKATGMKDIMECEQQIIKDANKIKDDKINNAKENE